MAGAHKKARTLVAISFASLLSTSIVVATPSVGRANGVSCNPQRTPANGNLHDGWTNAPGATVWGVYSNIYNYQPSVNTSYNPDISTAWVMLVSSTNTGYLAQVGWEQRYNGSSTTRHTFEEGLLNGSLDYYHEEGGAGSSLPQYEQVDSSTYYTAYYYHGSQASFTWQVNGTFSNSSWPAYFTPTASEVEAEVTDSATQLGGDVNTPVSMADSSYYTSSWLPYDDPTSGLGNTYLDHGDASYLAQSHHSVSGQGGTINVWDEGCPHQYITASDSTHGGAVAPSVGATTWSNIGSSIYQLASTGNWVGWVQYDGSPKNSYDFYVKDESSGTTYEEYDGVKAIALGGTMIGVLDSSNNFYAKSGLTSSWTTESSSVSAIAISNNFTVMIYTPDGNEYAKTGLTGGWTTEAGSVNGIAASGSYLGQLSGSNELYVKTSLNGSWTDESGCGQIDVSANYIGCLSSGHWEVKTGGVSGSWVDSSGGCGGSVSKGVTGDNGLAVICSSGDVYYAGGLNSLNWVQPGFSNIVYAAVAKD